MKAQVYSKRTEEASFKYFFPGEVMQSLNTKMHESMNFIIIILNSTIQSSF